MAAAAASAALRPSFVLLVVGNGERLGYIGVTQSAGARSLEPYFLQARSLMVQKYGVDLLVERCRGSVGTTLGAFLIRQVLTPPPR